MSLGTRLVGSTTAALTLDVREADANAEAVRGELAAIQREAERYDARTMEDLKRLDDRGRAFAGRKSHDAADLTERFSHELATLEQDRQAYSAMAVREGWGVSRLTETLHGLDRREHDLRREYSAREARLVESWAAIDRELAWDRARWEERMASPEETARRAEMRGRLVAALNKVEMFAGVAREMQERLDFPDSATDLTVLQSSQAASEIVGRDRNGQ